MWLTWENAAGAGGGPRSSPVARSESAFGMATVRKPDEWPCHPAKAGTSRKCPSGHAALDDAMQSKRIEELVEQSAGERKVPSGRQGRSGAGGSARMWWKAERTGGAVAPLQFRIGFGRIHSHESPDSDFDRTGDRAPNQQRRCTSDFVTAGRRRLSSPRR